MIRDEPGPPTQPQHSPISVGYNAPTLRHLRSFGEQLRRHREAAGLSQQELAEQAGLTANAVGALERGEQEYRVPTLEQSPTMRLLTTRVRAVDPRHLGSGQTLGNKRRGLMRTTTDTTTSPRSTALCNGQLLDGR